MLILALECSAKSASSALLRDGRLLGEEFVSNDKTHSETLLPGAEQLLLKHNVPLAEIGLFAVTAGPGSFTGLRIGLAAVKGLAFPNRPCLGLSTLEVIAEPFRGREAEFLGLLGQNGQDGQDGQNGHNSPTDQNCQTGQIVHDGQNILNSQTVKKDHSCQNGKDSQNINNVQNNQSVRVGQNTHNNQDDQNKKNSRGIKPEGEGLTVCAVMDARGGQFYNALFCVKGDAVTRLTPDRAIRGDQLAAELKKYKNVVAAGDGAAVFCREYPEFLDSGETQRARYAAQLAYRNQDGALPPDQLICRYLRRPQAERERLRRLGQE